MKVTFVACLNVTPATFEMIRPAVKKINLMEGGGFWGGGGSFG